MRNSPFNTFASYFLVTFAIALAAFLMGLSFLAFVFFGEKAFSFPVMVTKGYQSCVSCHVSPSGGGVLNAYGRGSAGDILSTWSYENEASETHGALEYLTGKSDLQRPIYIGADVRSVQIQATGLQTKYINMQKEAEIAVLLDDRLTIVGSVGQYARGKEHVKEYRRSYLLYNFNQNVSLRIGKFIPAYGIHTDDHTLAVRSNLGYGEGRQSNNVEGVYSGRSGEIALTSGVSKNSSFGETEEGRYRVQTEEKFVALRASYNLFSKSLIGLSVQAKQNDSLADAPVNTQFGFFGISAVGNRLSLHSDNNWKVLNDSSTAQWQPFHYEALVYEPVQGLFFQLYYERVNLENEYGAKVQWFPRPHWDLSAGVERVRLGYVGVFLVHYYL